MSFYEAMQSIYPPVEICGVLVNVVDIFRDHNPDMWLELEHTWNETELALVG